MQEPRLSNTVNQHYLNKVMDLAETMEVQASEDILDARGNKLLAKGAKVSRGLQEKLVMHKLTRPLESCIIVGNGVDPNAVMRVAHRIADTSKSVAHVLSAGPGNVAAALKILGGLKFGNAMSMMLTIADKEGDCALDHAVTVSLLAIGIACKSGLSESDQRVVGMAGLLHDIGELYIDPAYMVPGKRLLPHEWAHRVVHPHTGQMLINELEAFPAAVGRAVAEHHERFDGSGYPRRSAGANISNHGQLLSIAEIISGVLNRERPLERAALALRIIPGEHAKPLLAAVSSALREQVCENAVPIVSSPVPAVEDVRRLETRIELAILLAKKILVEPRAMSARSRDLVAATIDRVQHVQRAIISTGLDMYLSDSASTFADDAALLFEKEVATREIQWRLRDIARDLALQAGQPEDRLLFVPLVNLLDDDFSSRDYETQLSSDELAVA